MDPRLIRAINAKSASRGGLNFEAFVDDLSEEFPRKARKIASFDTRKELEEYCQQDRIIQSRIRKSHSHSYAPKKPKSKDYFKSGSTLSVEEQKMCRCIAHVSAQNPGKCYRGKNPEWKKGKDSAGCRNPYGICRARLQGGGSIECYKEYDFRKMPQKEVDAIKKLHGKK